MWRSRRGYTLIGNFIAGVVGGILGRNGPESSMVRTERMRAMREAVHAACREGLGTAIEGVDVPVSFGFPQGLPPLVDESATAAPVTGQHQPSGYSATATAAIPGADPKAGHTQPWGPGAPPSGSPADGGQ
jgi:hypothetical protein